VSFPGGMCDETDVNRVATALREAEEEIGLPPDAVQVRELTVPTLPMLPVAALERTARGTNHMAIVLHRVGTRPALCSPARLCAAIVRCSACWMTFPTGTTRRASPSWSAMLAGGGRRH
jgi:8-oxo-dGTP pyrophosphatase MutT (NUDIX family)